VDHLPPDFPVWLAGLLGAWLVVGIGVYYYLVRTVLRDGGKVSSLEFKEPDLWVCCGFILWFLFDIGSGFGAPERDVTQTEILHGAALITAIVVLLLLFMQFRGLPPLKQFGVLRRNPFLSAAIALGLVVSAHPLVLLTGQLTAIAMHGKAQPQNVVEFFMNATQKSDTKAVCVMLLLAGVVAPAAEETIFRGYIYGVLKRNIGAVGAGLLSAALFGAMHMNLAALPALFVLALCLTLAYEATGSLLVNIFMHAFFNLSMLMAMLALAHQPPPP
jgi:membrane protease YdiL (CAAX protease family)